RSPRAGRQLDGCRRLPGADGGEQCFALRGGLGLEILAEPFGELLVSGDRARAIAEAIEQRDQPAQRSFLMRSELGRTSRPPERGVKVARALGWRDQGLRAARRRPLQSGALAPPPALQFPRLRTAKP